MLSIEDTFWSGKIWTRFWKKSMWEILKEESEKEQRFSVIQERLNFDNKIKWICCWSLSSFHLSKPWFSSQEIFYRDFSCFSVVISQLLVLMNSSSWQNDNFDRLRSALDFRSINLSSLRDRLFYLWFLRVFQVHFATNMTGSTRKCHLCPEIVRI